MYRGQYLSNPSLGWGVSEVTGCGDGGLGGVLLGSALLGLRWDPRGSRGQSIINSAPASGPFLGLAWVRTICPDVFLGWEEGPVRSSISVEGRAGLESIFSRFSRRTLAG